MGNMLHHRFPNDFTDLFMDENDREVSILTDRAFRSLCIGDDAAYNDDFLYGYSPFNCHKPLAGEPKKTCRKEFKKQGQNKIDKSFVQHQESLSNMSSFLKALSATEESCEGMLNKNGDTADSTGESWDKSALRSIQRELSEFSSNYGSLKDASFPSEKSSKKKNGKSTAKLKKLNIRNFFFHSEFSPFQTWRNLNRFPFGPECISGQKSFSRSVVPADNIPTLYDMCFYKELTEAHRKDSLPGKEEPSCHNVTVEPPPPIAEKQTPPRPPSEVPKKNTATPAKKSSSSDRADENSAPWRQNRLRAKSVIPNSQTEVQPQENRSEPVDQSLPFIKKELQSVEMKIVAEVCSYASTPFSICKLMTPVIPSRQPTETSEILQSILSPSIQDLLIRPHSEAKIIAEVPIKRDSYKSLASSILFNLKDNRKRVKSRYSPPKFKTSEVLEGDNQSPKPDHPKVPSSNIEGNVPGLSTPILEDEQPVCSPPLESTYSPTNERPLLDDHLLSNLLQSKMEAANNSGVDEKVSNLPFIQSNTKNSKAQKQNYPSLYLYRKPSQDDGDMENPQVSLATEVPLQKGQQNEANRFLNKVISPKVQQKSIGLSSDILKVNNKDSLLSISEELLDLPAGHPPPNTADKARQSPKDNRPAYSGEQLDSHNSHGQSLSTKDVVRAAKEAIHAAKSKAFSSIRADKVNVSERGEVREREADRSMAVSIRAETSVQENNKHYSTNEAKLVGKNIKKEPPPVPKKRFANSNNHLSLDKHQELNSEQLNGNCSEGKLDHLPENKCAQKPDKGKHIFSTRQNSYIKSQRYSLVDENQEQLNISDQKVNRRLEGNEERSLPREMRDSEHIINDLHALKELERTRLGDHFKLGHINLDEEAKAKNNLISRELKNIKKGMLSMKGNTLAKRDLFASKERENIFPKTDNNAIRNKMLNNEKYEKVKIALEDFLSEREKKNNQLTALNESHVLSQGKDSLITDDKKLTARTNLLKDLKESLGDVRDHNHIRQILAQAEPGFSKTSTSGSAGRDSHLNTILMVRVKPDNDAVDPTCESEETLLEIPSGKNVFQDPGDNKEEAPPVPPRSKRARNRRDSSVAINGDSEKSVAVMEVFDGEGHLAERTGENWETQAVVEQSTNESVFYENKIDPDKERWEVADKTKSKFRTSADLKQDFSLLLKCPQYEHKIEKQFYADDVDQNKNKAKVVQTDTIETSFKNANGGAQGTCRPEQFKASDNAVRKDLLMEEPDTVNVEGITLGVDASRETPRDVISPLLSINGAAINQNPLDQSSQSSKSSYFSVESALHRNPEADVYLSLDNLIGEAEFSEDTKNMPKTTKTVLDYYCLSDPKIESEDMKGEINIKPAEDKEVCKEASTGGETRPLDQGGIPVSPPTTFSPPLEIPALFKVKDNTVINKKNVTHLWSPKGSLSGSERGEEETHRWKDNPDLPLTNQTVAIESTVILEDIFRPNESSSNTPPVLLQTPSKPQGEKCGGFLTVPQEEERFSGASPSSAVESLTTSVADTGEETGLHLGLSKVPSERSGSTCSGNDSQTGLHKPPAVLPKSEKAVLRALKLTHRRMKKEVQRSTHKPDQSSSSSKLKTEGQDNKTEHQSSNAKNSKSGGKEIERKKTEGGQNNNKSLNKNTRDGGENLHNERRRCNETQQRTKTDMGHQALRQSPDSVEGSSQASDSLPRGTTERQGRSSIRHVQYKTQHRHYSTDRVISNVPVYKAHTSQRSTPDRTFQRSQSIDRDLAKKAERRSSTDMSVRKIDQRTHRVEQSITEGFQQRGRSTDKLGREQRLRRSHSIDSYSSDVAHPSTLSRQSNNTGQLSRQSSIEHAIVAQSFPLTQRKLLQDPDSGQYFFVDMPIQVKTKTFLDPETGSYVQLPVQPPEGAATKASALEVLSPPVVVYHGFVPVPLSPMAQNGTFQAAHAALPEFEQRHREKPQQMHCKDKQPYLEPIYAQNNHTIREFMGTEELDCPS